MEICNTSLNNLLLLKPRIFSDERGSFIKQFSSEIFRSHHLDTDFTEAFYSVSHKGVLRGMHFQTPPKEHTKLVFVSNGAILDVCVDLRRNSPTFRQSFSVILDSTNHLCLYIPKGFAHGFLSLCESSKVHYMQTSCYDKSCDSGIAFDSFGFDWYNIAKSHDIEDFTISPRDREFESLETFCQKGIF